MAADCHICRAVADGGSHVYDEGAWVAYAAADVPGWVMLATKEHLEGMWSLSVEQSVGLGPAIRALGRAVIETTGAQRAHLVFLGESGLHFHLGFFPRAAGEPPLLDNAPLIEAAQTAADAERARVLAQRIRSALRR